MLVRKRFEFEAWGQAQQAILVQWHYRMTREMFEEIMAATSHVARDRGYDLVIAREARDLTASNTPELLDEIVARRKVVYFNPDMDITQAVIERVNRTRQTGS